MACLQEVPVCPQHREGYVSCPNAHTPQPEGYSDWQSWAHKASKTHRQIRCPGCQLFKIWVSRVPGTPRKLPKFEDTRPAEFVTELR